MADDLFVWPRPTQTTSIGAVGVRLHRKPGVPLFRQAEGCCTDLLQQAFDRYERIIYWSDADPQTPSHIRARVPGLRNGTASPELARCDGAVLGGGVSFGSLEVRVRSPSATPLQLHVDEAYSLRLTERGGTLTAPTEWGVLRGLETFAQLVQWGGPASGNLLCGLPMRVDDRPAHAWRGLLVDTARHFYPVADLLQLLDAMAALKLNTLHWHLVDAPAFAFGSESVPELPAAGALHPSLVHTHADVRAVVAAARLRGIRVVPELDMPAHAASWAHAEPSAVVPCPARVSADAEGLEHGMDKAALHPLSERTYELADALLTELAGLFPDEYVHLGGDEVDGECWLEDARIREWALAHGPAWKERLMAKFSARVLRRVAALGKRPVLWDEALEMAPHLPVFFSPEEPPPLTIDAWRDWQHLNLGGGGRVERWMSAPAAGHQVVWSSLSWYLDLPANTWQSIYSLQLPTAPPAAFLGGEASGWSETADPTNVQQRSLTRLAAAAELLWSGTPSELTVAKQRLASMRCRLLRRGLQAEPVIPDHCAVRVRGLAASPPATPPNEAAVLPAMGAAQLGLGLAAWQLVAAASLAVNAILLCAMLSARWRKAREPTGRGARKGKKD